MNSLNGFGVFVQVAETRSFVAAGRVLGFPLLRWARVWPGLWKNSACGCFIAVPAVLP